jgi:hypothetical protein
LQGRAAVAVGRGVPEPSCVTERTDAERWADADSIVDGHPTEFALQELQRYRRRMKRLIWSLVGFMVLVAVATALVVIFFGHHSHSAATRPRTPLWLEIAGLSCTIAGTVILVIGLVRYVRSGTWRAVWRSPALVLTWRQRRELSKEIRGRAPLDPGRLKVARHVAELAAGQQVRRFLAFLFTGGVLEAIGQLVTARSAGASVPVALGLVAYAIGLVLSVSRQRQLRAFLERTGDLV